jgi:uncharacterized 2Fe-2S/4Fe-4S cluster protein (DUF4445 family)
MEMLASVAFLPDGRSVEVEVGSSLLEAASAGGIEIDAPCGGQGRCGRCKVTVQGDAVERRPSANLSPEEIAAGCALACQTSVTGDVAVTIPAGMARLAGTPRDHAGAEPEALPVGSDWRRNAAVRTVVLDMKPPSLEDSVSDLSRLRRELARHGIEEIRVELSLLKGLARTLREADWKVTVTLEMRDWVYGTYLPPRVIAVAPGDVGPDAYGLAIDLGTTSTVAYLVDFGTAQVVDTASAYNRQISCGEDVISRIVYSQRGAGLAHLQRLALETINGLVDELCDRNDVSPCGIHEAVVAGNTTMTHFLLGLDPKYLREEPYIPTISIPPKLLAAEVGLSLNPLARVHCMPAVSSYIGGDVTAGVISSGMSAADKLTLFIDIGTNGEIVLGTREWLVACACSAGPAFEGSGVWHGTRATAGAIEEVWIDDSSLEASFHTIDHAPAVGICGSGLIDLLGELFMTGVVDRSGCIDVGRRNKSVRIGERGPEYVVAWAADTGVGRDITITERDIGNLLRAKAAIYAGFSVLCRSVGVEIAEVEQILIGGAFGQYIDVQKAVRIGLLPDVPAERFRFVGNTSALGAYMTLLCVEMRQEVLRVADRITYVELSADNTFMNEYNAALFLPHTDGSAFPSVALAAKARRMAEMVRAEFEEDPEACLPYE